jgi:hypothetical protein
MLSLDTPAIEMVLEFVAKFVSLVGEFIDIEGGTESIGGLLGGDPPSLPLLHAPRIMSMCSSTANLNCFTTGSLSYYGNYS